MHTFQHTATKSFYGNEITPPLQLEISYEVHRGRPVFRKAVDQRGLSHEIELLNPSELHTSYLRATGSHGIKKPAEPGLVS